MVFRRGLVAAGWCRARSSEDGFFCSVVEFSSGFSLFVSWVTSCAMRVLADGYSGAQAGRSGVASLAVETCGYSGSESGASGRIEPVPLDVRPVLGGAGSNTPARLRPAACGLKRRNPIRRNHARADTEQRLSHIPRALCTVLFPAATTDSFAAHAGPVSRIGRRTESESNAREGVYHRGEPPMAAASSESSRTSHLSKYHEIGQSRGYSCLMTEVQPWARFADELPDCCTTRLLRLPRPLEVFLRAESSLGRSPMWDVGLDPWTVQVGVSYDDEFGEVEFELGAVLAEHLGRTDPLGLTEGVEVLAAHGMHLDDNGDAWIGEQNLVVAILNSDLAAAAGRMTISNGRNLFNAADAEAQDLMELVEPLVPNRGSMDLWSKGIVDTCSEAEMADAVILLRAVDITPVMRGHRLGAWAAAQSIALFDHGSTLVVTKAAPLEKRDAIPGFTGREELTPQQTRLWNAEQARLAEHWRTHLGLNPLPEDPNVLFWYSAYINDALKATLGAWAR